ncbi:MAG: ABC transporter ATP-binding protein [Lachnospiraceae bacterium]|nr:ABC transporter ATP-binding protein [Lachnospiraceae bacterium]
MLRIEHLTKNYKSFSLDCTMEVKPGCVTGLIGQNGAGKSTTFKAALGLVRPDGGTIRILGRDIRDFGAKDRQKLGVVLSDSGFSGYLTVADTVPVLGSLYEDFDKAFFLEQISKAGLPDNKKIKEFSTGMKAKLKVITAISHNARLLILDEPTSGLDVVARDELLELLREFMEKDEDRSILISSHISGDLETLCDDVYMIHEGRIVLHEDTDVLLSDYAVLKVDERQYDTLDKQYILRCRKESFGYSCLTNQKRYYLENYPKLAVIKGTIDEVITMMIRGAAL